MQLESKGSEHSVQANKKSFNLKRLPKEVWIGWVSSTVEAYNIAIYSFIAPMLALKLFQTSTEETALFFSYFLVFIGSCFLYPLGALYYGLIGDKQGRQKTCIYSTLGLAIATGLMGLVPNMGTAWIYFLILLCAQFFFSGGEYYGSIVFALEHSEEKRIAGRHQGLMSSCSCLFSVLGLVSANGMAALSLSMGDMWIRVCFLAGAVGGLISYLLKNYCKETPAFSAIMQETTKKVDWISLIRTEWKKLLRVTMVFAFFMVSYSFIFIFLPLVSSTDSSEQGFDTFKSLIAYGVFLVAAGWLADRWETYKVMSIGIITFSLLIIPLCYVISHLLILQLVLTACACLAIGPIHNWMMQQFAVSQRCRGIFISSGLAIALFSGSTVPICLMIFEASQSLVVSAIYPFIIALASLYSLCKVRLSSTADDEKIALVGF